MVSLQAPSTHDEKKAGKEKTGNYGGGGGGYNTKEEAARKRERKVRLMHVSRPLMGGLSWAPENAGELDMITVDKYTAVLKSYPGEREGEREERRRWWPMEASRLLDSSMRFSFSFSFSMFRSLVAAHTYRRRRQLPLGAKPSVPARH